MTWLARLKNSDMPTGAAAKTDKSPNRPLSSVLSVTQPAISENHAPLNRAVVRYQLRGKPTNTWNTAIGPGPRERVVEDILRRWPDAVILGMGEDS